ncbi:MAG: cobalamin-dependent protein [Deltaproteobacteria bacterium]|nr:cobalamin-dependent protein [Deltaproteobacteria bacterium]
MKITIISPPFGKRGEKSDNLQMAPPILEYLASFISSIDPSADIELIDANREDVSADRLSANLFMFSSLTPQIPWVYKLSDELRRRGQKTVIGGMHATVLPAEARAHADAIVVGEAEAVLKGILADAASGCLKPVYTGERLELNGLPRRRRGLLKSKYRFDSFFTARGCPYGCTFCSVRKFLGAKVRYRPVEEVVAEVAESPYRMLMNIDDNIWGPDIKRATSLFDELKRSVKGKWWFGQADLATVQHEGGLKMLEAAGRSGLTTVMVGWESNDAMTLGGYDAKTKQGRDRIDALRKIRGSGIDVMLFVMVGARSESFDEFQRVLDICDTLDVAAHPVMLTPFPGTDLYEKYSSYMFRGVSWDDFDGNTALFEHDDKRMTPFNREQAVLWVRRELFTWPRILRRIWKISAKGFPMAHINSLMLQWAHRRAFGEYALRSLDKDFDIASVKLPR